MGMKWASFAVVLGLLLFLFGTDSFSKLLSADPVAIREMAEGNTWFLMLITLMLMTLQNLFTVIPLFLLVTVNITLFDFPHGYLWSWVTSIIGAVTAFLMTRFWFQSFFIRYVNERFRQKIEDNSFWMVLAGRLLPLPSSVVNIATGISSVGMKPFLYATIIGNMVYILILSFISHQIMAIPLESYSAGGAALVLLAWFGFRQWRRKRRGLELRDK